MTIPLSKLLARTSVVLVLVVLLANYSWVHAALVISDQHDCAEVLVQQAKQRLAGLYQEVKSTPQLVCLDQPQLGLGHVIGTAHFAPGLPTIIVVNGDGQNVDVLAHEWAHAEFAHRVGVISRTYRVPAWFDEGLAMQVDWRDSYADQALGEMLEETGGVPALNDITTLSDFVQPGVVGRLNYAFSRCVVAEMLKHQPLDSLLAQSVGGLEPRVQNCSNRLFLMD